LSHTLDLQAYLSAERELVEKALVRAVDRIAASIAPDAAAAVAHGVLSDGKRLRPILCSTAYRACGGTPSDASYDLAAALELVHAYSLMHDDLPCMDDADLRRGRPTTHTVHGEEVTLRAGAALIPAAAAQAWRAAVALDCSPDGARAVVGALLEAAGAGGMVGGQWMDLEGEGAALTSEEIDDLHRRKTGALLTAALRVGSLAAATPEPVRAALAAYGAAVGLAFQIADDILDATQSAEVLGKNPSDAALDKSTYVSRHGLEAARRLGDEQVRVAVHELREAGLDAPELEAIARYVMERSR
jgi:geranylgeranyl diphosphate synthase type II